MKLALLRLWPWRWLESRMQSKVSFRFCNGSVNSKIMKNWLNVRGSLKVLSPSIIFNQFTFSAILLQVQEIMKLIRLGITYQKIALQKFIESGYFWNRRRLTMNKTNIFRYETIAFLNGLAFHCFPELGFSTTWVCKIPKFSIFLNVDCAIIPLGYPVGTAHSWSFGYSVLTIWKHVCIGITSNPLVIHTLWFGISLNSSTGDG